MAGYPSAIEDLIERLVKFPGIGRRSAERIIFYLLDAHAEEVNLLSKDILRLKSHIHFCRICNNLGDSEVCSVCSDSSRQIDLLCIVETPKDVGFIERTGTFKGLYHVLLGSIAPLEGRGPSDLKIDGLLGRVKDNHIHEVIIATDSDIEGETTALYISKLLKPFNIKISRIGIGIPVGSNIEYADSMTLSRAIEARREL
ncbi:recombination mediator RecR [Thermoproteota archaeon]